MEFGSALRVLFCVGFALLLTGCGEITLYSGLKEKDANEMLAILYAHGIDATKVAGADNTVKLTVQKKDFAGSVDILSDHGFPRENFASFADIFKQGGMVSSPAEDRIRYIYVKTQSLSETLTQIDGVLAARVEVVPPDNNSLADVTYPSSASVFIKYNPSARVEDLRLQVKQLVVNSIQGLKYEKVSLVLVPAEELEPTLAVAPVKTKIPWATYSAMALVAMAVISMGLAIWFCFVPSNTSPARKPAT